MTVVVWQNPNSQKCSLDYYCFLLLLLLSVHRTAALAAFCLLAFSHSSPFLFLFSPPSFVFLLLPCGRNCFVRPPGLSGSQWSAIPGPSRRQPLALQRWNSPLVCQCPLLIAYAFTDGCWFFPDGKKISVEGNQP